MKAILGTMTFSDQVDAVGTRTMLDSFASTGQRELDTAYMYNDGATEILLGELLSDGANPDFAIATKVNPWDGDGLSAGEVRKQFSASLERLGRSSVDLLYLHGPDRDTPILETLEACQSFFEKGCFREFGLSNYAAWEVAEAVELCRSRGWVLPTVYQGLYNALNRDVESELMPCLRHFGIRFYAYNPLAGGLLTGKHQGFSEDPQPGRFEDNPGYQSRYWTKAYFAAMEKFSTACDEFDIRPGDAAIRWMVHHSAMSGDKGDGIILGASKPGHLAQNLDAVCGGRLPDEVIAALDAGWELVRPDCFRYFR